MANEWRESTVGQIAAPVRNALVGGPFGSNLVSRDYVDGGVPAHLRPEHGWPLGMASLRS